MYLRKELYWKKALSVSQLALTNSHLRPITTDLSYVDIGNQINFEVRSISTTNFKFNKVYGPTINPFLPWDNNLEIANIGSKHVLILNKYPVQVGHMLLITNTWRPQNGWLDESDWRAFNHVDRDTTGLWFFNSCREAGASQGHRHIQLLRRHNSDRICPLQDWYSNSSGLVLSSSKKIINNIWVENISDIENNPSELYKRYLYLSSKASLGSPTCNLKPNFPYNLLISSNWIVLIKRSKEYSRGFSLNALAFAGYLLSKNKLEDNWLLQNSPIKLLEDVI
ncbi:MULTISPECIES: ATP adenylyltransferase [unclassified Prochlorococcus]|uniref:ATP adenylyltransferase n=1 Tax=unclassified Prochlorococcus TaxID=2627481 RepID=UPI000533AA0C|nr:MULTISPECIES: ATP adenylyltransferase [unclassified Prochlorococcus]KGG15284.1 ATP adenylyltransferase [Prochlorococcus sp. MIT 0602]KGG17561.1 ATP adenylyltransferase [Prochlorococcus sp. MIT 0603]